MRRATVRLFDGRSVNGAISGTSPTCDEARGSADHVGFLKGCGDHVISPSCPDERLIAEMHFWEMRIHASGAACLALFSRAKRSTGDGREPVLLRGATRLRP